MTRYIAQRGSSGSTVFDIARNEMFCCIPKSYCFDNGSIAFGRAQDIAAMFNRQAAQAIEAQRAETENTDSVHESAVAKGDAP